MSNLCTTAYGRVRGWALAALVLALWGIPGSGRAEVSPPPQARAIGAILRELVDSAQSANLELAGAGHGVEARLAALEQARARYWPRLDLDARYSAADGGRTIDVPVGDLVNPIYAALSHVDPGARFPTVANQEIAFQRTREQDTKFVLTQPLYDPRLGPARDAAAADLAGTRASYEALAERVTRDVEQAYLRLLEARANVEVLDATLELARENVRVNDSLVRHGKATRDVAYRAEADLLETTQRRLQASTAVDLARAYVNLLRNAPLDTEVPLATLDGDTVAELAGRYGDGTGAGMLASLEAQAVADRRELAALDAANSAAHAEEALARAATRPSLALSVWTGTQGSGYGLGADDRYVLASLVVRFTLFDAGGDRAGVRAAHALAGEAAERRADAENRVRLEVRQALSDYAVARASIDTARKRLDAARAAFAISQKKRDLGQINQAEFIDARRALTDAAINVNQTSFGTLAALAELDYAAGRADRAIKSP